MKIILLSTVLMTAVSVCGFAQEFNNIPRGDGFYINKIIASPCGFDQTKELIEIADTNEVKIAIYDVNGKIVKDEVLSNNSTDISQLSKGIYLVTIQSNNAVSTQKLIKL